MGTVHGAYISGEKAANEIINDFKAEQRVICKHPDEIKAIRHLCEPLESLI